MRHGRRGVGRVGAWGLGRRELGDKRTVGTRRGAQAEACGAERGTGATRELGARPGRAAGPAGSALCALSLFLARFDSIFFQSLIFGHCS